MVGGTLCCITANSLIIGLCRHGNALGKWELLLNGNKTRIPQLWASRYSECSQCSLELRSLCTEGETSSATYCFATPVQIVQALNAARNEDNLSHGCNSDATPTQRPSISCASNEFRELKNPPRWIFNRCHCRCVSAGTVTWCVACVSCVPRVREGHLQIACNRHGAKNTVETLAKVAEKANRRSTLVHVQYCSIILFFFFFFFIATDALCRT